MSEHGTIGGYKRHFQTGTPPCSACSDARREYDRNYRNRNRAAIREHARLRRRAAGIPQRAEGGCGTGSGYAKHYRDGTPVCSECRDARRQSRR